MLGEMFVGDSADMCAGKFPLVSMGGWVEGLTYADPGTRTPIGASEIMFIDLTHEYMIKINIKMEILTAALMLMMMVP